MDIMSELPDILHSDQTNNDLKALIQEAGTGKAPNKLDGSTVLHNETLSGDDFEGPKVDNSVLDDQTIELHFDAEAEGASSSSSSSAPSANLNGDDDELREEAELLNLKPEGGPDSNGASTLKNVDPVAQETSEARRERRRRRKEEKRLRRKAKEAAKHHHKRKRDRSESDAGSDSDNAPSRPAWRKDQRQTVLDSYPRARRAGVDEDEDDAAAIRRRLLAARAPIADAALQKYVRALEAVIATCLQDGAGADDAHEAALLAGLRPLAACDVGLAQLRASRAGVVVGHLLMRRFPARVRALAAAVLAFWFRALPAAVRRGLRANSEVDRCSTATARSGASGDPPAGLPRGPLGPPLLACFAAEAACDEGGVGPLCGALEAALAGRGRESCAGVLAALGDPANAALRRALLDGRLEPAELVARAGDLGEWATPGPRNLVVDFTSPGSPTALMSPSGRPGEGFAGPSSPLGPTGAITTLYPCPNCGAREAVRSTYSVQAHDSFPCILKCQGCSNTWNINT